MRMKLPLVSLGVLAGLGAYVLPADAHTHSMDPRAGIRTGVGHRLNAPPGVMTVPGGPMPTTAAAFSGPPYTVGPVIGPTTTAPEAEEEITVDPNNSANLLAAISDFSLRGGYNTTKYAFSTNNGASWTESFVPLSAGGFPMTGDGRIWEANSDPMVANDRTGRVFLSQLYLNASNNANGFYVSGAGRDPVTGSIVFGQGSASRVAANPSPSTNVFEDKPWIAVDNSNAVTAGNVYVTWTHFAGGTDAIYFARSSTHAHSWSSPIRINSRGQNGAVQGSQVAVGPNGRIYVVYELFRFGSFRQQYLATSTNGGLSFSSPVAITPLFNELTFASSYRTDSFAALAVSPTNGNVYVAYSDQPNGSVGAEVEFVRSSDGGATFSAPVVINDSSVGQQFFPALAVDGSGVVHASWFDTRNGPANASQYDIYATRSTDNGVTFSPNTRVTPALINAGTATFIGDYAGIAAGGGFAHPVWTNGGFNNGRLQTAALQ